MEASESNRTKPEEKNEYFLILKYLFGYNCKKSHNLVVLDKTNLLFASGYFLNFFNIENLKLTFRRSMFDGSVGCISKNPNSDYSHFIVGEEGKNPTIIIYEWPSLNVVKLLRNSSVSSFMSLCYSPNGQLLVAHSGKPDFMLTIFDWRSTTTLFKIATNPVTCKTMFSLYHQHYFTSFGPDYVKFWEISNTFTGSKLKEYRGSFGQTTSCNIFCVYVMPDQSILSSCEWGNMLVWENGFIKVEIGRKLNKKCHDAPITQFLFKNNELWSLSMDGRINIWYYKKIDFMTLRDGNRYLETEPMNTLCVSEIMLLGLYRQNDGDFYFSRDGNGGLWLLDLNIKSSRLPVQLYKSHSDAIVDIDDCAWNNYVFSLGSDGTLQMHDFDKHDVTHVHKFPARGCCLLCLPENIQPFPPILIMGFDDGNLRVAAITTTTNKKIECITIQIIKSHTLAIRKIALNESSGILASASDDYTIFVYYLVFLTSSYASINPIGYVQLPEIASCLSWKTDNGTKVLIGGSKGYFATLDFSTDIQTSNEHTYLLKVRPSKFVLKCKVTGKELSNKILFIRTVNCDIWFSMDGSDSGIVYKFTREDYNCSIIYNANGVCITDIVLRRNKVFMAMENGCVTIANLPNFLDCYCYTMHNNNDGFISKMCFSRNNYYFYTCGYDGHIFVHKINSETNDQVSSTRKAILEPPIKINDYNGYTNLSLEELKTKKRTDIQLKLAVARRQALSEQLKELQNKFDVVTKQNNSFPKSQRLSRHELEIDRRFSEDFDKKLKAQLEIVKMRLHHKVEKSGIILKKIKERFTDPLDFFPITVSGINIKTAVSTINQTKLSKKFYNTLRVVEDKLSKKDTSEKWEEKMAISNPPPIILRNDSSKQQTQSLLHKLPIQPSPRYKLKINQSLKKRNANELKLEKRKKEREVFNSVQQTKINSLEDQNALILATSTIGDYKLKSSPDYKVPRNLQITVVKKYHQLLKSRLKQYNIIHDYNKKIYQIRSDRVKAVNCLHKIQFELDSIHEELTDEDKKFGSQILFLDDDCLEKNIEVVVNPTDTNVEEKVVQLPGKDLIVKEVLIENIINLEEDSKWEIEARYHRKNKNIYRQQILLNKFKDIITTFDNQLNHLGRKHTEVQRDVILLDLHMITLNQELIILKEFEFSKQELYEKLNKLAQRLCLKQNETEKKHVSVEEHLVQIKSLRQNKSILKKQFFSTIQISVHYNYIKSIFNGRKKGKYLSEQSLTDTKYFKSLRERDQELYEKVIDFHKQRSDINERIKDKKRKIEQSNNKIREIRHCTKKIQNKFKFLKIDLDTLLGKQQKRLNEVMCTVVLKLDQLQYLSVQKSAKIADSLIFSQNELSNLYKQVGQLHNQTQLEKTKHKTYTAHFRRMNRDCHVMKEKYQTLQNQIKDDLKKKFGVMVNIDAAQETSLKQKMLDTKISRTSAKLLFEKTLLHKLNNILETSEIELRELIKSGTSKLKTLVDLQKEKSKLLDIINKRSFKKQRLERVEEISKMCKEEIKKLSTIIKTQKHEKLVLEDQIKCFSYKTVIGSSTKISDEIFNFHLNTERSSRDVFKYKSWEHKEPEPVHKNDEEELTHLLQTTDVQIPYVLSDEIEEMIQQAIVDMLDALGTVSQISVTETKRVVQQIVPTVLEHCDVKDIIKDFKNFLPKEHTTEQENIISDTATTIFLLLHPELNF